MCVRERKKVNLGDKKSAKNWDNVWLKPAFTNKKKPCNVYIIYLLTIFLYLRRFEKMAKSKMYEKNMNKVDFNNLVLSYLIENSMASIYSDIC